MIVNYKIADPYICKAQGIDPWHDLAHLGEIPCARRSLLSGIASGMGVGVIRGLSVGEYSERWCKRIASNNV